ncbi:hypothetical protein Tco_1070097 [Tanacetum coccineum]|uniref:Uncharacterized protein n=1 Tax=Tanacetum coccineum TaxID=301880 RepID=A0ABQ5HMB0_9ASTR
MKEEKGDEAKDDESTKNSGKRRKQMARKGMNTNVDENDSEDSDKVDEQEETNTGYAKLLGKMGTDLDGPEDKVREWNSRQWFKTLLEEL